MMRGTRTGCTAPGLGWCGAGFLFIFFAIFPQAPAKAASLEDLPDAVVVVLGEAATGIGDDDLIAIVEEPSGLLRVWCELIGGEREFVFGPAGDFLWAGSPDGPALVVNKGGGDERPDELPQAVVDVLGRLLPELEIQGVREIEDIWDSFEITGDVEGASVRVVIAFGGWVLEFEIDRDRDGLGDAVEIENGWDPLDSDSDDDMFPDGVEQERGGNPGDASVTPRVLDIRYDAESKVIVATVETFEGCDFFLEAQGVGSDVWVRIGEAVRGNGLPQEFAIPGDGFFEGALLRATIATGGSTGAEDTPDPANSVGEPDCSVPADLVGRQMVVTGGKRLHFKTATRGELVEGSGGDMLITPFAYTFDKRGKCEARVTLTFNTVRGFETTVYRLTFREDGSAGAFIANEFEQGELEDAFHGNFTITMNP